VGQDLSILALAQLVARVVGFDGELVFDSSKPDGTPRKLVDTTKINALGWRPRIGLEEGVRMAYAWFRENVARE
jgi:GDP-L-fucose synthase